MPTCINHPAIEETVECGGCNRPFCEQCVVQILGRQLCGECKTTALQGAFQRPAAHPLAVISLAVPVAGYLLCVPIPITSTLGLWLGWRVLRELELQPHLSGRGPALAALVVSGSTLATWVIALIATIWFRVSG